MFKTHVNGGSATDVGGRCAFRRSIVYLRPETKQGIFINFLNVLTTSRRKLPFGVAQIGKSFRNEVTPGNFIFRTREFEQMEMEYFVRPGEDEQAHQEWIDACHQWVHGPRYLKREPAAIRAAKGKSSRITPNAQWISRYRLLP